MAYLTRDERHQASLLPAVLDDYVEVDSPVRVIDAFVENLDVRALGFYRATPALTGRPGYNPCDLLKLYLYAYLNEVRSSRRIERECRRNVEVMWLIGKLIPDHKTIADFRRINGTAIVATCREFVLFCREQGLFKARLVAIDGSKVRAAASPQRVLDRGRIAEEWEKLDSQIVDYLARLDSEDSTEITDGGNAARKALSVLKERRTELEQLSNRLDQDDRRLVVQGEPEARPMGFGCGGKPPSYNVQIAVDADTGIVLHHAVTDEVNDQRMLYPMAKATKELLDIEELTVVADTGYSNGNAAAACENDGIVACVPVKRSVNNRGNGEQFGRSSFRYIPEHDHYICPAGRILHRKGSVHRGGYYYFSRDCSDCGMKAQCTQSERRSVSRHQHEDALERMVERVAARPDLMRLRRCAAEHPFGTIKRMMTGRFLTRGIKGTSTEMALSVLAFNLIRCINLKQRTV
ncbi:IS1182 family transposase [Brucella endophytica]|uniref:IS1182 family transposase n=1 Tax=Brucella endophytica TaxID=1963359 RepID=A0A916WMV4_9HYPH|nr:IS1182 family transposase [Brucella endophytica]GGB12883.1 IS1182 family transposase [Brucella endophytica]